MANYVIVYAFDDPPEASVSEALQLADRLQLVRGEEHPDLWISWSGFHEIEPALADALAAAKLRSAALLPTVPPPQDRWLLTNWRGQLAVHGSIASHLDPRFWTATDRYDLIDLRTFAPSAGGPPATTASPAGGQAAQRAEWVQTTAEYRASLDTSRPTLITAPAEQITSRMRDWFGDLADDRVGGAIAVLAMSGVRRSRSTQSQIVLRNPAALGLQRVTGRTTLATHVRTGTISARAWGTSSDDPTRGRRRLRVWRSRSRVRTREEARSLTAELAAARHMTGARYGVLLELTAVTDAELLIGTGLVFEQEELNGVQNLAIAAGAIKQVEAGRPVTTALAAWCLNRLLIPPSGQSVRPTALVLPLAAGADQDAVWTIAERSLASFGGAR